MPKPIQFPGYDANLSPADFNAVYKSYITTLEKNIQHQHQQHIPQFNLQKSLATHNSLPTHHPTTTSNHHEDHHRPYLLSSGLRQRGSRFSHHGRHRSHRQVLYWRKLHRRMQHHFRPFQHMPATGSVVFEESGEFYPGWTGLL